LRRNTFTPTAFNNGKQQNAAGENSGSVNCSLHKLQKLSNKTVACFGAYYFEDV
jgi:hypothetical protein